MPEPINMLTDVRTMEVSLVKRGANNKRIALTKSEYDMKIEELFKSVLATEAEGEDQLVAALQKANASEEAVEIAKCNYRLQHGFKDKLDADVALAVAKAAGYDFSKAEAPKAKDEPKPVAKTHVPAEMPKELEAVFKAQSEELEAVRKESAEKDARLARLEKEAIRKEFVAKCEKQYSHVPGMSADEQAEMLQKAYEVDKDLGKKLEKQWADTAEALKKSALLASQGVLATNAGEGSAWGRIQSLAKELVKTTKGLREDQALDIVMKEHEDLYKEYLSENPAQTGERR